MSDTVKGKPPVQTYAVIVLLAVLVLVGAYDLVAIMSGGKLATISQVIQGWSHAYPPLSILAALLFAHLFGRKPPTH